MLLVYLDATCLTQRLVFGQNAIKFIEITTDEMITNMRFFHVSAAVWTSIVGEKSLKCSHEKENEQEEF